MKRRKISTEEIAEQEAADLAVDEREQRLRAAESQFHGDAVLHSSYDAPTEIEPREVALRGQTIRLRRWRLRDGRVMVEMIHPAEYWWTINVANLGVVLTHNAPPKKTALSLNGKKSGRSK